MDDLKYTGMISRSASWSPVIEALVLFLFVLWNTAHLHNVVDTILQFQVHFLIEIVKQNKPTYINKYRMCRKVKNRNKKFEFLPPYLHIFPFSFKGEILIFQSISVWEICFWRSVFNGVLIAKRKPNLCKTWSFQESIKCKRGSSIIRNITW